MRPNLMSFFDDGAIFNQSNASVPDSAPETIDCSMRSGQKKLSVLPGSGWDNLVNEERGLTTNREVYKMCRTSADGNYLIPDDMIIGELNDYLLCAF